MSARVFNPLVMSEMRRMIGRSSSEGQVVSVTRVRRDLFGEGTINHEDSQAFVERELAAIKKRESEKWGFDFAQEKPLENSRYKWERVSPEENIPEAYAFKRLGLLGQNTLTTTSTDNKASTTTTQRNNVKPKSAQKQTHMTDYMRCRKRSLSLGDLSAAARSKRNSISSAGGEPVSKRSRAAAPHSSQ